VAELPATLLELGVEPSPVFAAAEVPADLLRDPENRISFPALGRLMDAAVEASGCPHLGILLGLRGGMQSLGLVGRLMATAPTVREAILDLCINQVRYIDGAVTYLTEQGGAAYWGYAVRMSSLRGVNPILDGAIGIAIALIAQLAHRRPDEVRFSHAAPPDAAAYRRLLGTRVTFDAEQTCVVLSPELLAAPTRGADPVLRRQLQQQVAAYRARKQPTATELALRALAAHVTAGKPSLGVVAASVGLGPRTLNRRLEAEGTSFRGLLDTARHDVACQLLATTRMAVTEIGTALGYATPSGFARAFRRSAGRPPTEWRRLQAALVA
jgi:AraC-like DNA-binding protein